MLSDLMSGEVRSYTQFAEALSELSDKVLSERLREFVSAGLVRRSLKGGLPRRTEYQITARGQALRPLLIELYCTGLPLQAHDATGDARSSL